MNLEKEILFKLVDKLERSKDFKNGNLTSANIYLGINDSLISPLFSSTGYLKVLPSTLSYGLYNVIINDITADIDMMNNNSFVNFKTFTC